MPVRVLSLPTYSSPLTLMSTAPRSLTPAENPVVELRASGGPESLRSTAGDFLPPPGLSFPFCKKISKVVDGLGFQDSFQRLPALGPQCSRNGPDPPQAMPSARERGILGTKRREPHQSSHKLHIAPKHQPLPSVACLSTPSPRPAIPLCCHQAPS